MNCKGKTMNLIQSTIKSILDALLFLSPACPLTGYATEREMRRAAYLRDWLWLAAGVGLALWGAAKAVGL